MSTIIRNAAKGRRVAMETLYEANKSKVFYAAKSLLLDSHQAASVTTAAFKEAWHYLKSSDVSTEAEFTQYVLLKAIGFCKGKAYRKNPKAFRIPFNKNFLLPVNLAVKDDFANELAFLLANLPVMHRYIFVLHTVCGLDELQIGRVMKCESGIIAAAIEAEPVNFERLQHLSSKEYTLSYEEIVESFVAGEQDTPPLNAIDEQASATINAIATPIENQAKKTKHTVCVIGVLVCACLLIAALIVFLPGDSASSGTDDTSGLETEDTSYYDDESYLDEDIYTDDTTGADDTSVTDDASETDDTTATDDAAATDDNTSADDTTGTDDGTVTE